MTDCPYDLILGLDRSDKKADLCLIETAIGKRRTVQDLLGHRQVGTTQV